MSGQERSNRHRDGIRSSQQSSCTEHEDLKSESRVHVLHSPPQKKCSEIHMHGLELHSAGLWNQRPWADFGRDGRGCSAFSSKTIMICKWKFAAVLSRVRPVGFSFGSLAFGVCTGDTYFTYFAFRLSSPVSGHLQWATPRRY